MVCIRCKMVVKDELSKLGFHYTNVELREADILENISALQRHQFKTALLKSVLKQNSTIVIVPSSAVDTMQLGSMAGFTALTMGIGEKKIE